MHKNAEIFSTIHRGMKSKSISPIAGMVVGFKMFLNVTYQCCKHRHQLCKFHLKIYKVKSVSLA